MRFTKMHGLGNDYVYVNGFVETVDDPNALARAIADRHFGVGGDGLILILPSDVADVRMRMFNADGSEGEMCGNGVRCVAKYAFDHRLAPKNPMRVETGRGILNLELSVGPDAKVTDVCVDMDEPILELEAIPFIAEWSDKLGEHEYSFDTSADRRGRVVPVSMGNPHAVFFVDDLDAVDLAKLGPAVERTKAFPQGVNAHWAQVIDRGSARMKTWERGSGITLACGTGACAVLVAGVLTGRLDRVADLHLPGGTLRIEWDAESNRVFMTGPATEVFSGEWFDSPPSLASPAAAR